MGRHYANVANNFVSSVSCKTVGMLWIEIVPQRHLVATQTNLPRLGLRAVVGRPRNGKFSLAGNGTKVAVMSATSCVSAWSKTLNITGQVNGHSSSESYSPLMMQKKIDMNSPLPGKTQHIYITSV